jgi:hypothetical protein
MCHLRTAGNALLTTNKSTTRPSFSNRNLFSQSTHIQDISEPRFTSVNMGKNTKRCTQFINSIPDEKLSGFVTNRKTIFSDTDWRLDMQGVSDFTTCAGSQVLNPIQMTSDKPAKHNLQVQINYQTTITSLKEDAPDTVATLIVPADGSMSVAQVRQGLIDAITI